jgi:hypothetical protein
MRNDFHGNHECNTKEHFLTETVLEEHTIEIAVFLFFTWARNNRPDCGKLFIPKHDLTNPDARCDTNARISILSVIQTHVRLVSLQMRE